MILTCPECSARYVVDPNALRPNGRVVRCAKCKASWKEQAPDDATPVVDAAEADGPVSPDENPPASAAPAADTTVPDTPPQDAAPDTGAALEDDFALQRARRKKRPRPLPKGSNLPALQDHKHGNMKWGWYSLAAFIAALVSSFLIFQSTISHVWPPSQHLYEMLGMTDHGLNGGQKTPEKEPEIPLSEQFKIGDTVPTKTVSGGLVTLKVEGTLVNLTDETRSLPLLKISLLDAQGQILRDWTFKADAATAAPDEKVSFSTSLPNPPEDAARISVTFAPRN
ncbi:MJ0042-type zinc finger domain-containing protein [Paremcibacter congregatus]|uniref:MJ0042-type zinc finger domain-containing protein n=1 Tax=Paremcibacter congregatus TaxID=2043170 RepID=UPI003A8DF31F|tara:strand:- start:1788 stop:2633 length:846 start_codon:yes stop_codon:yes gene_type:complete